MRIEDCAQIVGGEGGWAADSHAAPVQWVGECLLWRLDGRSDGQLGATDVACALGACSVWGALAHNGNIFTGSTFLRIVMGFGRGTGLGLELSLLGHDVAVWV